MIFDFIHIENGSDTALWRQIYEQFAAAVDGGRIAPLTRLPSIRELAAGLSVSRSPVENAYERLHLDGYICLLYTSSRASPRSHSPLYL